MSTTFRLLAYAMTLVVAFAFADLLWQQVTMKFPLRYRRILYYIDS